MNLFRRRLFLAQRTEVQSFKRAAKSATLGATMVTTQKRVRKNIVKLSIAAFAFASFGAAVAAPLTFVPRSHISPIHSELQPLAAGPAIQLAKAGPGAAEDCVRVTRMTGPDGKEYPTRGIVCTAR